MRIKKKLFAWLQDAGGADESAADEKDEAEKEVGRMGNGDDDALAAHSLHHCIASMQLPLFPSSASMQVECF